MDLHSLRKPTDGLIARYLNRRVSLAITPHLIHTPIHPNHISMFTMILGIAAGIMVSQGTYWTGVFGAFLLQLQSMLDGVDGELARVRSQCSRVGQWLDTLSDDLSELAILIGLTIASTYSWSKPLGIAGIIAYLMSKSILYTLLATVFHSGNLQDFRWEIGKKNSKISRIEFLFKHDFLCLLILVLALFHLLDIALILLSLGSVVMGLKLVQQLLVQKFRPHLISKQEPQV